MLKPLLESISERDYPNEIIFRRAISDAMLIICKILHGGQYCPQQDVYELMGLADLCEEFRVVPAVGPYTARCFSGEMCWQGASSGILVLMYSANQLQQYEEVAKMGRYLLLNSTSKIPGHPFNPYRCHWPFERLIGQ